MVSTRTDTPGNFLGGHYEPSRTAHSAKKATKQWPLRPIFMLAMGSTLQSLTACHLAATGR